MPYHHSAMYGSFLSLILITRVNLFLTTLYLMENHDLVVPSVVPA